MEYMFWSRPLRLTFGTTADVSRSGRGVVDAGGRLHMQGLLATRAKVCAPAGGTPRRPR